MRHIKKTTAILLVLFVYITVTAAYFLPRNADISEVEKWIAVGVSYAILAALWWVLKHKLFMGNRYSLSENDFIPEARKK